MTMSGSSFTAFVDVKTRSQTSSIRGCPLPSVKATLCFPPRQWRGRLQASPARFALRFKFVFALVGVGACVPTALTPVDTGPTVAGICPGASPIVRGLAVTPRVGQPNAVDLQVELDASAALAVVCTASTDPNETLVYQSDDSQTHDLALRGLAAGTSYACDLVTTCPASAAPYPFSIVTDPFGDEVPTVEVRRPTELETTGPPFVVLGHDRHCPGDSARMMVLDIDGTVRWVYEDVPDIDVAYETQYLGEGIFTWGGGYYDGAPPEVVTVDQMVAWTAESPMAQSRVFHHDGRQLPDGRFLLLMIERNTNGDIEWDGFSVAVVDPELQEDVFVYNSQSAVDAGDLAPGPGDPWHANWVDYQTDPNVGDRLYVSLCHLGWILAIDAATHEVVWTFGPGGDFVVSDGEGGTPPPERMWPQCQHGLEFVPAADGNGGRLLVYDNGNFGRGRSRAVEYLLNEQAGTATLLWDWTEPRWVEPAWGDIDYLPDDHVLITMGHACWSPLPNDVSSIVELHPASRQVAWRMDFTSPDDSIYRSERVDACDVFPVAGLCPDVAALLADLAPLLDACADGPTDETCNGLDDNCDGEIDEGFERRMFYVDRDGDGYGSDETVLACVAPPNTATQGGDCHDGWATAFPGARETCDGIDDDCDGAVDELPECWSCVESTPWLACGEPRSYADARQICLDLGADLASIESVKENDAVASLAGVEAWIGLDDREEEGRFVWVDGNTSTFTNWFGAEPNDSGDGEDCAGINFVESGGWNDYRCGTTMPFVCRLPSR